jgi:hypothetical protein
MSPTGVETVTVIWIVSPATFILILLAEVLFGGSTDRKETEEREKWAQEYWRAQKARGGESLEEYNARETREARAALIEAARRRLYPLRRALHLLLPKAAPSPRRPAP